MIPQHEIPARDGPTATSPTPPSVPVDLTCRVCELEAENARLRLLVSELLTANQQLRERARAA